MIKNTINAGALSTNTLELTPDLLTMEDTPIIRKQEVTITTLTEIVFFDSAGAEQTIAVAPAKTTAATISAEIQTILSAHGFVFHRVDGDRGFGLTVVPVTTDFKITFHGYMNIVSVSGTNVTTL